MATGPDQTFWPEAGFQLPLVMVSELVQLSPLAVKRLKVALLLGTRTLALPSSTSAPRSPAVTTKLFTPETAPFNSIWLLPILMKLNPPPESEPMMSKRWPSLPTEASPARETLLKPEPIKSVAPELPMTPKLFATP